ncbi:2-oxo acid dehydrogenase subunit E2, partial [candidate division KSB3 bacterium]|nr:2-oxo acid dehydrogenase subunit E2 [candidate division KSB3 bacterium]
MATEVLMPRQGITVESCLLLEWRKSEGDAVQTGETLCEVETDKATFEVEAETDGTLLKQLFDAGADVPVLTPIAIIGQPGEDISGLVARQQTPPAQEAKPEPPSEETPAAPSPTPQPQRPAPAVPPVEPEEITISPRARNLAALKGVNIAGISGTGPNGRIIERDILGVLSDTAPLTPAAIAAQLEQGLQAPPRGSGIGGRVTVADLLQAPAAQAEGARAAAVPAEFPGPATEK